MYISIIVALLLQMLSFALCGPAAISAAYEAAALPLISNTVNAFPYFIDLHQYGRLARVFTSDAVFNSSPNIYRGRDTIIAGLAILTNVSSQHGYTSQYTQLTSLSTAKSTAYLFSNFYGQGTKKGEIFTVYGRYDFTMKLVAEGWRAKTLTLTTFATTGDETIVYPSI